MTSLVALQQTGQYFEANVCFISCSFGSSIDLFYWQWNGTTFGDVTKLNGTSNSADLQWGSFFNNAANGGVDGGGIPEQGNGDGTVGISPYACTTDQLTGRCRTRSTMISVTRPFPMDSTSSSPT